MRKRLTDKVLQGLKTDQAQIDVWDTGFSGAGVSFGVRVSRTGRKTFVSLYRGQEGKQIRKSLGTYPTVSLAAARKKARTDAGKLAIGEDPKKKRPEDRTVGELAEKFMEVYPKRLRPRTVKEYRRILDHEILPVLGEQILSGVTRTDVNDLLDDIAFDRNRPVMANRTLALLSVMFNFGIDQPEIWGTEINPCYRVKKRVKEKARQRILDDDEIRALWAELEQNRALQTAAVYQLILVTAQRPGEVKAMHWDQIVDDVWTIPAEIAKNKTEHRVPLSQQALRILEILKKGAFTEWVFPSRVGGHIVWSGKNNSRIQASLGFKFRPHDLRRTASTGMSHIGIDDATIGRVLNHSWVTRNVTAGVYIQDDRLPEKRVALERWGARLEQILTEEPAKVVRMK